MNALTPITEFLPPALFEQDLAAADTFIAASKSAATVRAYRCDWAVFTRYCDARGVSALPASAEVIAAFLAHEAAQWRPGIVSRQATGSHQIRDQGSRLRGAGDQQRDGQGDHGGYPEGHGSGQDAEGAGNRQPSPDHVGRL